MFSLCVSLKFLMRTFAISDCWYAQFIRKIQMFNVKSISLLTSREYHRPKIKAEIEVIEAHTSDLVLVVVILSYIILKNSTSCSDVAEVKDKGEQEDLQLHR